MTSILISILMFCLVVIVHEFGHMYAAKKNGVLVEEFAIGMGPKLFGVKSKKDDTLYTVRAIPLGGYCKMLGEDSASTDSASFTSKKVSQRMTIIAAGIFMNFVLAFVLQFILTSISVVSLPSVGVVSEGGAAEKIGLAPGDTILKYDGKNINVFYDIDYATRIAGERPAEIVYRRAGGEIITTTVTPTRITEEGYERFLIGFIAQSKAGPFLKFTAPDAATRERYEQMEIVSFREFFTHSTNTVLFNAKIIFYSLRLLLSGAAGVGDMMGPIGLAGEIDQTYTETIKIGFFEMLRSMLNITILLSANLAVVNALPLPAVDGGRFLFLIFEALRGKPIDPEKEGMVHLVGMALLMVLALFIAFNDVMRLIGR
jgi:regulator of sigma E protease